MRILLPINFEMKEKTPMHRCIEKDTLNLRNLPQKELESLTTSKVLEVLDRKIGWNLNLESETCRISLAKEITENLISSCGE